MEGVLFLPVLRHIFSKGHSGHACRQRREEEVLSGARENHAEIVL